MMKRLLCLVLCLLLAIPSAMAETADTLQKLFVRQLTGGNGARGYISLSASGVADWLNLLLPFTATEIQVRAIGQKQGDMSETVDDDDDWQIRFYVKDSDGQEAGTTWLYGNPKGMYFQSELLPDTLLTLPVTQVNLLYQLFRGEFADLFFAFDPLDLSAPGANGNASAYTAVAEVLGIPADTWTADWLPVLDKYFTHIDLWLAGYGESSIVSENTGSLTMSASYSIPVDDLKAEAKYLIGQMMYDNDLQNLLLPYVTMEQRVTYLNPQMLYFYEACIDALPLNGNVVLSREMSAMGEVVSTAMELPLPPLPDELTATVGKAAKALLHLSDENLLEGVERLVMRQSGQEKTFTLSSSKHTVTLSAAGTTAAGSTDLSGTISILPGQNGQGDAVTAAFSYALSNRVWQDEKYLNHDTTEFALAIKPVDDEAQFQPLELAWTLDYRNNPSQQDSPVQVNLNVDAKLPDAQITAEAVMRITTQMKMETLPTTGAEDAGKLTDTRKEELLNSFVLGMANLVTSQNTSEPESTEPAATDVPEPAPTLVPTLNE
ncbi:MAG: hypothetical protein ACI4WX_01330 [Aristaeellaceae bacterium]